MDLLPYNCSILFIGSKGTNLCGNPAFVGTMFVSSMSFVERWERFAAVQRLGRTLEGWERIALAIRWWSSCPIFGCGPHASGWERLTLCHLNEKWSSHYESMCASRRGQVIQMWMKIVHRAKQRAYWRRYERIGAIIDMGSSVHRRKSRNLMCKYERKSYEYWQLLERIFPGAATF
jgi:hypothetical protein